MIKILFQPGWPTSPGKVESGPSSILSSTKDIGALETPGSPEEAFVAKRMVPPSVPRLDPVMVKRGLNLNGSDAAFFNENMIRDAMSGVKIVIALENENRLLEGAFGVEKREGLQSGVGPDSSLNECGG